MENYLEHENFAKRHIGPRDYEVKEMLETIGINSIEELINETVPDNILLTQKPVLDAPLTESELIEEMEKINYLKIL